MTSSQPKPGMKPVLCRNCFKVMFYCHVFVGEVKHKCGYTGEYHVLTDSFIKQVQEHGDYVHEHEQVGV
jgi:hypothetical protein